MGWKPLTRIPLWFRPLKPLRSIQRLLNKTVHHQLDSGNPVTKVLSDDIERCLESFAGESRLHTPKSVQYLKWRYAEIPGIEYFARFDRASDHAALLIYRVRTRWGLAELSISEALATASTEGTYIGRNLMEQIARETDADYAIAIAAEDTSEADILKDSGFFPIEKAGPILTLKLLNELPLNVMDWSNWRCSIGDLELF